MTTPPCPICFIGFGEAAMAFVEEWGSDAKAAVVAFDVKTQNKDTAPAKADDYARFGVRAAETASEAARGADLLISVVTADQALGAAQSVAGALKPQGLYCDFNSIAPSTKKQAAQIIESGGGRYVDVAVMAPVRPARLSVPLLVSGPHAHEAVERLRALGFSPSYSGPHVGNASTVKMLRSVMVKGMEALTAECFVAADAVGVAAEVAQTLNQSWPGVNWLEKADYNLDRMMVHGLRRAAEMDEVVETLRTIGADASMSQATAKAQRRIGSMGILPPEGLAAKRRSIIEREIRAA